MRILIAEDDTVSRRILQRAVERFGHECRTAENGLVAWQMFQDASFDVVLTDWVMPSVDGLELCRRIRENPGPCYTYVMLLSVLSDRGHFLMGMQAGADDYLTKPLDAEELEARLAAAGRVTALHRQLSDQNLRLEKLLDEQRALSSTLADTASARGRLEGVTLAAREMAHLLTNNLSVAIGTIEMLRQRPDLPADIGEMLRHIDDGLGAAAEHLRSLQRVVRVRTRETPVGPSLDLANSTQTCNT